MSPFSQTANSTNEEWKKEKYHVILLLIRSIQENWNKNDKCQSCCAYYTWKSAHHGNIPSNAQCHVHTASEKRFFTFSFFLSLYISFSRFFLSFFLVCIFSIEYGTHVFLLLVAHKIWFSEYGVIFEPLIMS